MTKLNSKLLGEVKSLLAEKVAFVPMPGGPPPGDPAAGGPPPGDPAAGGPPPGDPAAGGMPPPGMDPSMGGIPPPGMDPSMGGMPPPPAPPPSQGGMINMTVDEFLKFVKQIVALCTSGKFGNDPRPTDGGPVTDNQAATNAKLDMIVNAITNGIQPG